MPLRAVAGNVAGNVAAAVAVAVAAAGTHLLMRREDHSLQRSEQLPKVRRVAGGGRGRLRGTAPGKLRREEVKPALRTDVLLV